MRTAGPSLCQNIAGCTFVQLPCLAMLHPHQAQLIDGMLDCHDVRYLIFENGNGSIGLSISNAKSAAPNEIFHFLE
jgi:hypothetical protein